MNSVFSIFQYLLELPNPYRPFYSARGLCVSGLLIQASVSGPFTLTKKACGLIAACVIVLP